MKIDAIRARLRLHVVDATQKVIRVRVDAMRRTPGIHAYPATRNLESRVGDVQKSQNSGRAALDGGHQTREFGKFMPVRFRLPRLARTDRFPHRGQLSEYRAVNALRGGAS